MSKPGKSEFLEKCGYEGGIEGMILYQGSTLTDWNLPKDFKRKWEILVQVYEDMERTLEDWEKELP